MYGKSYKKCKFRGNCSNSYGFDLIITKVNLDFETDFVSLICLVSIYINGFSMFHIPLMKSGISHFHEHCVFALCEHWEFPFT